MVECGGIQLEGCRYVEASYGIVEFESKKSVQYRKDPQDASMIDKIRTAKV